MYLEEGPRTNNNLERWHSNLKKITGNIFEIVELFKKKQEASIEVEIKHLVAGETRSQDHTRITP